MSPESESYTVVEELAVCVVEVDLEVVSEKGDPLSFGPAATAGHRKKSVLLDGHHLGNEV